MPLEAFDTSPGQPFAAQLNNPELAQLFGYWVQLAQSQTPAYRTFDPTAVASCLPHLQIFRRIGDGDYRLDLVGESAAQLIGANNRGKLLSQVMPPPRFKERSALFGRPLASGLPLAYRSFLAIPGREHRLQKRLLLPFVENAAGPDLLIAMVVGVEVEPDKVPVQDASEGILETIEARARDISARVGN